MKVRSGFVSNSSSSSYVVFLFPKKELPSAAKNLHATCSAVLGILVDKKDSDPSWYSEMTGAYEVTHETLEMCDHLDRELPWPLLEYGVDRVKTRLDAGQRVFAVWISYHDSATQDLLTIYHKIAPATGQVPLEITRMD